MKSRNTHLQCLIVSVLLFQGICNGQLPKSSIYLADLKNIHLLPQVFDLKYLSGFNPSGYNNQPYFFGYDDLYLTVGIDTNQVTDIYRLDIKNQTFQIVTQTEGISEFSPTPTLDREKFSTVRIERDRKQQSLWAYPKDQKGIGERILRNVSNIGYHCWIGEDSVALFLVDDINKLSIGDCKTGKVDLIAENIGRCLRSPNHGVISFVHKSNPELWILKEYNVVLKTLKTICSMPKGREDFEYMVNGKILTGDGSKIKVLDPSIANTWSDMADFSPIGIQNITRLNIIRNRITFVDTK